MRHEKAHESPERSAWAFPASPAPSCRFAPDKLAEFFRLKRSPVWGLAATGRSEKTTNKEEIPLTSEWGETSQVSQMSPKAVEPLLGGRECWQLAREGEDAV